MRSSSSLLALCGLNLLCTTAGQGMSEQFSKEDGPVITLRKCTAPGSCTSEKKRLTIDANWRWVHKKGTWKNCYKGNEWLAPCDTGDGALCARECELEGNDSGKYKGTYGVTAYKDGVQMQFVNKHKDGVSVGSRLYVLDGERGENYEMFKMANNEFAFDAEMAELQCGMNGAIYFIEMEPDGGKSKGDNKAGAKFGTGYCDAQCPHDIKFMDGEANNKDWKANEKDKSGNMGTGHYGACCNEMDIWEANAKSNAYTPHPCSKPSMYRCEGTECGDNDKGERYKGVCDKDGCDYANYRMGNKEFYGQGSKYKVNTDKLLTQVTQFIQEGDTESGDLVELRRIWVQDGKVIKNAEPPHLHVKKGDPGFTGKNFKCKGYGDSLSDDLCKSQNERFGDYNHFQHHGGHKVMGDSMKRGHVLAISLWDDVDVSMMWLDSWFPRNKKPEEPGVERGPCEGGQSSTPTYVRQKYPNNKVKYTNIAVGCLGCTTPGVDKGPPARKSQPKNFPECPYGAAKAPEGRRRGPGGGGGGKGGKGDPERRRRGGRGGKGEKTRRRRGGGGRRRRRKD